MCKTCLINDAVLDFLENHVATDCSGNLPYSPDELYQLFQEMLSEAEDEYRGVQKTISQRAFEEALFQFGLRQRVFWGNEEMACGDEGTCDSNNHDESLN